MEAVIRIQWTPIVLVIVTTIMLAIYDYRYGSYAHCRR